MNLSAAVLRLTREHANFGHEIVVDLTLDRCSRFDIHVGRVRAKIVNFALFEQAEGRLGFGKRYPYRSPEAPPRLF
jgi:hypothetical protein